MVKSSETLAEVFRRVGSTRRSAGRTASIDDVIEVLGADLTDGKLDGRGAAKTDRTRLRGRRRWRSAQVLVESMTNTLRVGGQPVTTALDNAINQLATRRTTAPTAALPITAGMISAARTGTAAANAIMPSAALTTLDQRLGSLTPGMLAPAVAQALPSDASATLAPALTQIITGATRDIDAVNALGGAAGGATGGTTGGTVTNALPTISGSPATTVTVGSQYAFQPTASDPNGDSLTFSITNRPAWATFNTTTGRLEGTPAAANVGTTSNIVIGVNDGKASVQLPAFSIAVNAAASTPPPHFPAAAHFPAAEFGADDHGHARDVGHPRNALFVPTDRERRKRRRR